MKVFVDTTVCDILLRDGSKIPAGSRAAVTWENDKPKVAISSLRSEPFALSNRSVAKMFGFSVPGMEELEEMNDDCVVDSVLGNSVEPDGHDEYGAPSWLLALGLI